MVIISHSMLLHIHNFSLLNVSIISIIACLPLVEFESKFLTVMSSRVPCKNGIPITLITADCSNNVLCNKTYDIR